jgi:hypothetical protein
VPDYRHPEIPGVIFFAAPLLDCRSDLRGEREEAEYACAFPPYACLREKHAGQMDFAKASGAAKKLLG